MATLLTDSVLRHRDPEYFSYVFEATPLKDWHPAFGTIAPKTLGEIGATFTAQQVARLRFATYLARRYEINEGIGVKEDEIVTVPQ
jgi:hypothetical protein